MDKQITIVVKGADGVGRTQVVEQIKHALTGAGFKDVAVMDPGAVDMYAGDSTIRDVPIQIIEVPTAG